MLSAKIPDVAACSTMYARIAGPCSHVQAAAQMVSSTGSRMERGGIRSVI